MDLRHVAKGAPYHLATSLEECPLWRFWVVLLDSGQGMEIFQTPDEAAFEESSTWMRLRRFCDDHDLRIVGMAYAQKDLDQSCQINLTPQADGYFYSKRIRKMMAAHPAFSGYSDEAQGVGELKGDILTIHWIDSNTGRVTTESRDITARKKPTGLLGLIRSC
jgi:hypothetical protein